MNIFIYGDSNTIGQMPNLDGYKKNAKTKYYNLKDIWWHNLTINNSVAVDALPGRAIANENPWLDGRNASLTIRNDMAGVVADLYIIQLGTNDCKSLYGNSAETITKNLSDLLEKIYWLKGHQKVLIISPAKIAEGNRITDMFYVGASKKCTRLDRCYKKLCKEKGLFFVSGLDLEVGEDGEHLTKRGHQQLAQKINEAILNIDESMADKEGAQ